MSKLDGTTHRVELDGTILSNVVWGKTGNFLYFIVGRVISRLGDPNLNREPQLQRYDVRTQKYEQLLSLGESDGEDVFLSPDGNTLGIVEILEKKQSYTLMNLESLAKIRFEITEMPNNRIIFNRITYWSPDSQNTIFLSETKSCFYRFDVRTGKETIISGKHSVEYWAVSPVATTP